MFLLVVEIKCMKCFDGRVPGLDFEGLNADVWAVGPRGEASRTFWKLHQLKLSQETSNYSNTF